MGIDWEGILDAEGAGLQDAYDDLCGEDGPRYCPIDESVEQFMRRLDGLGDEDWDDEDEYEDENSEWDDELPE